ncbi:Os01g0504950 [Oryza sativa Japonica Group]|uniref:Os01g0504950 protein n=1 Tax=Oryza sativa subsp. japonica TaxID=39947 RepID=A0A0P0V301_ORYSJ|nr:hypothetical protein EE612_002916 [Oryza sativa]BAS72343.1 Os01g0504950 [Oryza sativa Japonica Group]
MFYLSKWNRNAIIHTSTSIALNPNPESPSTATTSRSGSATAAATQNPNPTPIVPHVPASSLVLGSFCTSTALPTSMVFAPSETTTGAGFPSASIASRIIRKGVRKLNGTTSLAS